MRIGIVGPFNPSEFKEMFPGVRTPQIHETANSVHALVRSFIDAGHTVTVFSMSIANKHEEYISEKLRIYLVPFRAMPRTSIFQVYFIRKLRKVIHEHLDEMDVLHAQWTYQYAYAARVFAKEKPTFCTVRDWCPYIMSLQSGWGYFCWRHLHFPMFRKVMETEGIHFIANSPYTHSRIVGDYSGKDVVVIPNSIKKDLILRDRISKPADTTLITIANGINDTRKNITTLLKAYQMLRKDNPSAILYIIGRKNENHPEYKQWQEKGLLNGVITTGGCTHAEVIDYVDRASVMVHPSLEETFGNTLIEAMARRIPVVGGVDAGAVPYVLGNGKYGVCCDVTSAESIYNSIKYLLVPENADKIVNNATQYLLSTYASDVVCEHHIELYSKYLDE